MSNNSELEDLREVGQLRRNVKVESVAGVT